MQETRPLTEQETAFAEAMQRFGECMEDLKAKAAAVKESGGDARYATVSTIEDEEERRIAEANWPMISMVFGLG